MDARHQGQRADPGLAAEIERAASVAAGTPGAGATWVELLLDALSAASFDALAYCRRQGWNLEQLREPGARVPWPDLVDLWTAAARSTGNPHLGLHAVDNLPFRIATPLGYLLASSATLLDSLSLMVRYQRFHFDQQVLALVDRDDHLALVIRLPERPSATSHQVEYLAAIVNRLCAWVVGPTFHLLGVSFRHAGPSNAAVHERTFRCPVEFRQPENSLLFPPVMLSRPSLFASPEVHAVTQALVDRRLADRSGDWARRLSVLLKHRVAAAMSIMTCARELGVSQRTLQRRLAAEGSSFEKIVDRCRCGQALEMIEQQLPVGTIASQVGFSGSRTFVRAFRRWTGCTPSAYRARSGRSTAVNVK